MPTNKEWIFSLSLDELYAWFDAEHVENKNGTLDGARTALNVTQSDIARQSNVSENSSDAFTDSRENLESEIRGKVAYGTSTLMYPPSANKVTQHLPSLSLDTVLGWLDRQAAITELECCEDCDIKRANERQARKIHIVCEGYRELRAQVDELTADRDRYRDLCIRAVQAGEKFATLVDMNGEVLS